MSFISFVYNQQFLSVVADKQVTNMLTMKASKKDANKIVFLTEKIFVACIGPADMLPLIVRHFPAHQKASTFTSTVQTIDHLIKLIFADNQKTLQRRRKKAAAFVGGLNEMGTIFLNIHFQGTEGYSYSHDEVANHSQDYHIVASDPGDIEIDTNDRLIRLLTESKPDTVNKIQKIQRKLQAEIAQQSLTVNDVSDCYIIQR